MGLPWKTFVLEERKRWRCGSARSENSLCTSRCIKSQKETSQTCVHYTMVLSTADTTIVHQGTPSTKEPSRFSLCVWITNTFLEETWFTHMENQQESKPRTTEIESQSPTLFKPSKQKSHLEKWALHCTRLASSRKPSLTDLVQIRFLLFSAWLPHLLSLSSFPKL